MMKNELPISWMLFRKALRGDMTEDETVEFTQWVNDRPGNRKYFSRAKLFYSQNHPEINLQEEDFLPAFEAFRDHTKKKSRKTFSVWLQVAASLAIIVTSAIFIVSQYSKIPESSSVISDNVKIRPGRSVARLTINNGASFMLENQDTSITMGDKSEAYLSIESGKVAYNRSDTKIQISPVLNRIEIPHGGEYRVTLPDGSELFINSESVVEYYVPFRDGKRELRVIGEIYLEVAKDTTLPFIVNTDDYSVRVLGTKFNVSAYPDDDFVATTLISGSVEIEGIQNKDGKSYVLEPSQQLYLDKSSYHPDIMNIEPDIYTAWTKGFFVFEEESLLSIFRKLERWYDINVIFFNSKAEQELFSGKLPRFENLEDIVSIIDKVGTVNIIMDGTTVLIR